MQPPQYPEPIIYGPRQPDIYLRLDADGKQRHRSRTNANLVLSSDDFNDAGTFTFARFLSKSERCGALHEDAECPLVMSDVPNPAYGDDFEPQRVLVAEDDLQFDRCPGWCALRDMCVYDADVPSKAQIRFLHRYCKAQARPLPYNWKDQLSVFLDSTVRGVHDATGEYLREGRLDFPALIPEVWLSQFDDPKGYMREPGRVDFVMLAEGRRCVIEVDGPSHYASFVRGSYEVDEARYTRNLAQERSLRRRGWEIHRFSNLEVEGASDEGFADLLSDLPGTASF